MWSYNSALLKVFVLGAALALAACGYRPLYGQVASDPAVTRHMEAITVQPIPERSGQLMRTALKRRLHPKGQPQSLYKLDVTLTERTQNLAEERSGFVTRANLMLTATYTLSRVQDGAMLTNGRSQMVASYNILDSDYATLSAEDDARERAIDSVADDIRTRLAIWFQGPGRTSKPGTR